MVEFLHPSVASRIIDNTTSFVTAQGQTALFAAFPAGQGPDNTIVPVTTSSERNFVYGAPNMRLYGQTAYNVNNWLDAGGTAYCMRVLPYLAVDTDLNPLQQSLYACMIVEVGLAVVSTVAPIVTPKVKVRVRTLGDGSNINHLAAAEKLVRDDVSILDVVLAAPTLPEADGFKYYPLFALRGLYRGAGYNSLGAAFTLLTSFDGTNAYRLWELDVFTNAGTVAETFQVAMYPDAADVSLRSQFLPNVLSQFSNSVRAIFSEANYDIITAYINPDASAAQKLDIFTLQERNVAPPETLHALATVDGASASLSPSPALFNPLGGGTDGDWVGPNSLDSLLFKAYSGSGDFVIDATGVNQFDTHFSDVFDKLNNPIDVILDANYSPAVKVAISNLCATRGDCFSCLDTGFTGSPTEALKYRSAQLPISSFFSAVFTQDFVVFDANSGASIAVTPTYYLAQLIPSVDVNFGIHWPFVGPRRGTIAGYDSLSWSPNDGYQEQLYAAKVNYIVRDTRTTRFATQTTSQARNSALSDISHVRTLLRIRRDVENMAASFEMEFNDPTTWQDLQNDVQAYLNGWVSNRALASAKGLVYASAYDKQQRILRVSVEVVFTDIIERVFIDLVVNN